ncbi:hypothetical protein Pcinc_029814 [Petrolisthes cinctipes]|uniref:Reverse transcriptase n=1 Tax=Petrolisthes cinctipes TaxID=88211 RepID=A0AAE1EZ92_PETCI|nr:hypothetical protein Pcinc_029814 [Petrolisthes cinctipes]
MDRETICLRRRKNKLYAKYLKTGDHETYARFAILRNRLRKKTRQIRYDHEENLARNMKKYPKAMWRYVNSRLKTRSGIEDLKREDGSMARTSQEKAEEPTRFISTTFTQENLQLIPDLPVRSQGNLVEDVVFSAEDILKKLKTLNPVKSPGPDGIHPRILVECAKQLCRPLTRLFDLSMDNSTLPSDWKKDNVYAIFKKGDQHAATNYRPVSLTCIMCKMMEGIIRDELMDDI